MKQIVGSILFFSAFSLLAWGAYQFDQRQLLQQRVENDYQRAFHEMSYEMDVLQEQMAATLAMNSPERQSSSLAEVWRLSSNIHADIGQLPLGLLPYEEMERFLSQVGEVSYRTAVRNLGDEPITGEEYALFEKLFQQSESLQTEIREVQQAVLSDRLLWSDIAKASSEKEDNSIINGFDRMNTSAKGYAETSFRPTDQQTSQERVDSLSHLKGESITAEQALRLAKEWIPEIPGDASVKESLEGAKYPFYTVTWASSGDSGSMDFTKTGGKLLYLLYDRKLGDAAMGLTAAEENAHAFLKEKGYGDLVLNERRQMDDVAHFTFVRTVGEEPVFLLTESIHVKVALDNGQITGFSGMDYVKGTERKDLPEAELQEKEAQDELHPSFQVEEARMVMMSNEIQEEVLCYEFTGQRGDSTYRIYINAQNGMEEKVEKLS